MTAKSGHRFLLVYGSQTGQSQAIAEEIADRAGNKGYSVALHCFSETDKKFCLDREPCVVIVTSSTGDGDPPDTVVKFWRRIKKKSLTDVHLAAVNFALLGLGDQNYNSFGQFPRNLEKRLLQLGAQPFYATTIADDAVGLEVAVDPWIDGLWPALATYFSDKSINTAPNDCSMDEEFNRECDVNVNPYAASGRITANGFSEINEKFGENEVNVDAANTQEGAISNGDSSGILLSNGVSKIIYPNEAFDGVGEGNRSDGTYGWSDNEPNVRDEVTFSEGSVTGESTQAVGRNGDKEIDKIRPSSSPPVVVGSSGGVTSGSDCISNERDAEIQLGMRVEDKVENSVIENVKYGSDFSGTGDNCKEISIDIVNRGSDTNDVPLRVSDCEPLNVTSDQVTNCDPLNVTPVKDTPLVNGFIESRSSDDLHTLSDALDELKLDHFCSLSTRLIGQSPSPLFGVKVTTPKVLAPYLHIEYDEEDLMDVTILPYQNGSKFPFASSRVFDATLLSSRRLTADDAVKTTLEIDLDVKTSPFSYIPGDAFSIVCQNDAREVDVLLKRLGVIGLADVRYNLTVLPDTKKKNPVVPVHIPPSGTLRHLFTTCLDIREPPKKATVRLLAEHTTDATEQRWLLELCSMEGASEYATYIREPGLSLLDVLTSCPSCLPPIARLIERLSRLQPRPYSASSCPLTTPGHLQFAFNVVDIPQGQGRLYRRRGVCSGWLAKLADAQKNGRHVQVPIFARTKTFFHLPEDSEIPLLLIGPGTGVAPFIGFLRHRQYLAEIERRRVGEAWLFFGCRHETRDYIYRDELNSFVASGALSRLCASYSRDDQSNDAPRYVQDNLRLHGADVVRLIEGNARTYVCGEARNMARGVCDTVIDVFMRLKGLSREETEAMIQTLRHERKYLEDVW